jgi:hypothetical protein
VLHPFLFTATVMVLPKRCEVRFTHPRNLHQLSPLALG